MRRDIDHRNDIILLVDTFYGHVLQDMDIGPFFTEVAAVDWEHHLPVMYSFWSTLLLGEGSYAGNPMAVHAVLNAKRTMEQKHFDVWVQLFRRTIDELFEGEKAEEAKQRGAQIAQLMHRRIHSTGLTVR